MNVATRVFASTVWSAAALVVLVVSVASCTASDAVECTSDADCEADEVCISGGGVFARGGICFDAESQYDAGVTDDVGDEDVMDAGGDDVSDVPLDAAEPDAGPDAATDVETDAQPDVEDDVVEVPEECVAVRPLGMGTRAPSVVATLFDVVDCDTGDPRHDLGIEDFSITEDGQSLSDPQTPQSWEATGHRNYVRLLLDLSGEGHEERHSVVAGAGDFVEQLLVERQAPNTYVGVEVFDGAQSVTSWVLPTDEAGLVQSRIDQLIADFGFSEPNDTNLHGAVTQGVESFQQWLETAQQTHEGGVFASGHLVVFSANEDTVEAHSSAEVAELVNEASTFDEEATRQALIRPRVLALTSEAQDVEALADIFGDEVPIEETDSTALRDGFETVADELADTIAATHLWTHCSAMRSTEHDLSIDIIDGDSEALSIEFDASDFEEGCDEVYLDEVCQPFQCGGAWCGGCADETGVCSDGQCVNYCLAGQSCLDGEVENSLGYEQNCVLEESFATCDEQCVDTKTDVDHCGQCDNDCPDGVDCQDGACDCGNGKIGCSGQCVDPNIDEANCGECGNECDVRCDEAACIYARQVAMGTHHSCAVLETDVVECWGDNEWGQLGNGEIGGTAVQPEPVQGVDSVARIFAGQTHSCALTSDNKLYCWGGNEVGQLGNGTFDQSSTAVAIDDQDIDGNIVEVALGDHHSCVLTDQSGVYCWGGHERGQVGIGSSETAAFATPQYVEAFDEMMAEGESIIDLVAGGQHTCAVSESLPGSADTLYCWGRNDNGQLGLGDTEDSSLPRGVSVDVTEEGSSVEVRGVAAGALHSCAYDEDGDVYCWGRTSSGRLGVDEEFESLSQPDPLLVEGLPSVNALYSGGAMSCAVMSEGEHACWGSNSHGQLGEEETPVKTPAAASELNGVQALSIGGNHLCVVTPDLLVECRGRNHRDQLGDGTGDHKSSFVPVQW